MRVGDKYIIHSYKHNGKLYKTWDEAVFLDETRDYYVFGNSNTLVTKKYGKSWCTKEAAVMFFFKHEWFNVIAQLKKNGIYFYCNIASPVILENNETRVIKYIDYDLDLRIFPDKTYKILDKSEYEFHKRTMNYSNRIDRILKFELRKLIRKYNNNYEVFNNRLINYYNNEYNKVKENKDAF